MNVKNEGIANALKIERPEDILRLDRNEIVVKLEKGEGTLKIEKIGGIKQETTSNEVDQVEMILIKPEKKEIKEEKVEIKNEVSKISEEKVEIDDSKNIPSNKIEGINKKMCDNMQEIKDNEEVKENIVPEAENDKNVESEKNIEPMDVDKNIQGSESKEKKDKQDQSESGSGNSDRTDGNSDKTESNSDRADEKGSQGKESIVEESDKTNQGRKNSDIVLDNTVVSTDKISSSNSENKEAECSVSVKSDTVSDKEKCTEVTKNSSDIVKNEKDKKVEVKSEVSTGVEIMKGSASGNAEAVDRFKALFPELEVMHRLPEIDTTLVSEKQSRETTVAQLLQQSYQNPIKWPKVSIL